MKITWDEAKSESNYKKHGITFDEAATVILAVGIELEDRHHNEARFVKIGLSEKLNVLTVVYAYKFESELRIISARKATKKESKEYEKRIRFL